jgi:ligand-binding sensor domain-containing protein
MPIRIVRSYLLTNRVCSYRKRPEIMQSISFWRLMSQPGTLLNLHAPWKLIHIGTLLKLPGSLTLSPRAGTPLKLPGSLHEEQTKPKIRQSEGALGSLRTSFFRKLLASVFLLCLLPGIIHSQAYTSRQITMKDGLPSNRINDMIKDSRNFYWLATDAGLVKWYGNTFETYGIERGLPSLNITAIAENGEGNLWLGVEGNGVLKFDGRKFSTIIPQDSLPGQINFLTYSVKWDMILVATHNGFVAIRENNYKVFIPESRVMEEADIVMGFLETDSLIYIHSYSKGLYAYYPNKADNVVPVSFWHENAGIRCSYITSMGDTIWSLKNNSFIYSGQKQIQSFEGIATITGFAEDYKGNIYLSAKNNPFDYNGGIFRLRNGQLKNLNSYYGIVAERLTGVIYDKSDNIIVASDLEQGVFILYPEIFQNEFPGLPPSRELNIKAVTTTDDGTFWVLDEKDLYYKKEGESFKRFDKQLLTKAYEKFKKEKFPLKYSYWLDPEGSYGKYQKLIEEGKYHYPNPYYRKINYENLIYDDYSLFYPSEYDYLDNIKPETFKYITSGDENSIWILSNAGFFILKEKQVIKFIDHYATSTKDFSVADTNLLIFHTLNYLTVTEINKNDAISHSLFAGSPVNLGSAVMREEGLWLACRNNGIYLVQKEKVRNFNPENIDIKNSIVSLAVNQKGHLIAGSGNGHIQILEYSNDRLNILHNISPEESLTGKSIVWMEADSHGYLWVGTNTGVNCIDLNKFYADSSLDIRYFDKEDGYNEPAAVVSHVDNEGNIWIGGSGFLKKINTQIVKEIKPGTRNIIISQVDLDFNKTCWKDYNHTGPWTGLPLCGTKLKHYQNNLSFHFNITNTANIEKTLFRYRIAGLNNNWSPFDRSGQVTLPGLPPGKYNLEIEGQLAYEYVSRGKTEFSFIILPPWWETWWFYTLSALLLIIMFWVILILKVKYVRKTEFARLTLDREINELRIKALQAQMNPHFTFNAINSIQYYIFNNDKESAFDFINYFSKLIRQTLECASRLSVTIKEEVQFIENYIKLEQMRFENKFAYEIQVDPELDGHQYHIPPMLLQPFVENAILHGLLHKKEQGLIKIIFRIAGNRLLHCIVEDNGIGRQKAAEINKGRYKGHKSVGLDITRRRVGLMNDPGQNDYKVEITDLHDNASPTGTSVLIKIPLISVNAEIEEW